MKKRILLPALFGIYFCSAQTYQAKIMTWNLLNWPSSSSAASDSATRCPAYREVVHYVMPDVLVTQENTGNLSVPWFLSQVMNTGSYHYQSGQFINGYDSDNAIFYRDSLFEFISNTPIQTSLRDINRFTLVYKATGDTLHIFSLHLKASLGYETQREGEISDLRAVTNAMPNGSNFLVAGDFNIYASTEPAYVALLHDNPGDDGEVNDVLNMTGTWNNFAYAPYHTQSTHYNSSGGFAGGGMNDRFDMILHSNGIDQPGGIYYLAGSYTAVGNDGNHYNDQINWNGNSAVPPAVANALYDASDHIPVTMDLLFGHQTGIEDMDLAALSVDVFPVPSNGPVTISIDSRSPCKVDYTLTDALGQVIERRGDMSLIQGRNFFDIDRSILRNAGIYLLSVKADNVLINKRIIISQ